MGFWFEVGCLLVKDAVNGIKNVADYVVGDGRPVPTQNTSSEWPPRYPKWKVSDGKAPIDSVRLSEGVTDGKYWTVEILNPNRIPEGYYKCGFCGGCGAVGRFGMERVVPSSLSVYGPDICPVCGGWKYLPDFRVQCKHCGDIHNVSADQRGFQKDNPDTQYIGSLIRRCRYVYGEVVHVDDRQRLVGNGKIRKTEMDLTCSRCKKDYTVLLRFEDLNQVVRE